MAIRLSVITANTLICTAVFIACSLAYTRRPEVEYSEFHEVCMEWGYTWESYKVLTEDSWELTLFRITGTTDELFEQSVNIPILFLHGEF